MTRIVEADEKGAVHLDRELLGSQPGTQYTVDHSGGEIVLKPLDQSGTDRKPLWESLTPQERAADFLQVVREWRKLPGGPSLSDEAIRRENIYD